MLCTQGRSLRDPKNKAGTGFGSTCSPALAHKCASTIGLRPICDKYCVQAPWTRSGGGRAIAHPGACTQVWGLRCVWVYCGARAQHAPRDPRFDQGTSRTSSQASVATPPTGREPSELPLCNRVILDRRFPNLLESVVKKSP